MQIRYYTFELPKDDTGRPEHTVTILASDLDNAKESVSKYYNIPASALNCIGWKLAN